MTEPGHQSPSIRHPTPSAPPDHTPAILVHQHPPTPGCGPQKFNLIEQVDPLLSNPWHSNLEPKEQSAATTKIQARDAFQRWLECVPPLSMVVYTDGSKGKDSSAAGAGWVGYSGTSRTKIFHGHTKLPNQEVFDAEARAALLGLQAVLKDPKAQHSTKLYICLDNLEAVQQLQGQPTRSSQSVFITFSKTRSYMAKPHSSTGHTALHKLYLDNNLDS